MDEREIKLPLWARELLANLREQVAQATEPLARELAKLRPRLDLLQARNDALEELLRCATKGGHMTATDIVQVIEAYDLTLQKKDDSKD